MSDHGLQRDGSEAPALWAPEWGGVVKMGARFLLVMLIRWADGRGAVRAQPAEMAARLGISESSVWDYLRVIERAGWISKEAQGRLPDGTMSPISRWLNLEKLADAERRLRNLESVEAGEDEPGAAVGNPVDGASATVSKFPPTDSEIPDPPPDLGDGETPGVITTGARAGARARGEFPLPSCFLSFPWRDEALKERAARVLLVCGEGLGDPDQQSRVLESLAYCLDGAWTAFDFETDVLPVVSRRTGPGRRAKLWDFALLTENIETHRRRRLRAEAASGGKGGGKASAKAAPPDPARHAESLRRSIAHIEGGGRGHWHLPAAKRGLVDHWREDEFMRVLAGYRAELAALEAGMAGGTGDGGGGGHG